jgi:hypothetical protein
MYLLQHTHVICCEPSNERIKFRRSWAYPHKQGYFDEDQDEGGNPVDRISLASATSQVNSQKYHAEGDQCAQVEQVRDA